MSSSIPPVDRSVSVSLWAGKRTPGMYVADAIIVAAKVVSRMRGGETREIDRAGGEIASAPR